MPSVLQVYPSRISITPQRNKIEFHKVKFNKQCWSFLHPDKQQFEVNFAVQNNPFILSSTSKRKLFDSLNSMYSLSSPRKIEMKNKGFIYNFRMSFITLTLPSPQMHSDVTIKSKCLNQFLIEIKKAYSVDNFVWKAELQQNENIHFHLIIDKYIDFQALRRRWNRIINKLDYVKAYQNKMQGLSLSAYHALRNSKGNCDFEKSKAAYAKGCLSNWANPNSVDVRSVSNKKDLASYLAKYVSKAVSEADEIFNDEGTEISNDMPSLLDYYYNSFSCDKKLIESRLITLRRQLLFGRSWSRSYTLAKLKYVNKYLVSEMQNLISYLNSVPDLVKKVKGDFFEVYYFQASKLCSSFKAFHQKFMFNNAKMYGYPVPT